MRTVEHFLIKRVPNELQCGAPIGFHELIHVGDKTYANNVRPLLQNKLLKHHGQDASAPK